VDFAPLSLVCIHMLYNTRIYSTEFYLYHYYILTQGDVEKTKVPVSFAFGDKDSRISVAQLEQIK
jgi:hypothetical protein